jgi:hypothetical protein
MNRMKSWMNRIQGTGKARTAKLFGNPVHPTKSC